MKKICFTLSLVLVITLSGCISNVTRKFFVEGEYGYESDPVQFFDEIEIVDMKITLIEISESVYDGSDMTNVIRNQENGKYFSCLLEVKLDSEDDFILLDIRYLQEETNKRNTYEYKIILEIDKYNIDGYIDVNLIFQELSSIEHIDGDATSITIDIKGWEINDVFGNDMFGSLPKTLNIRKGDE